MAAPCNASLLQVEELVISYGGVTALMDINFGVAPGTIKAVIGPNGAGKTTLFNAITGFLCPSEGEIRFRGHIISGKKPHQIAALGISRTFQTVELFHNMTVLENIMTARHLRIRSGFLRCGLRTAGIRRQEKALQAQAMQILEFIGLADRSDLPAESLPLGERKILEIGRSLATEPRMVCLDEPAAGLNESETQRAARLIRAIKAQGITVLLVEHDMKMIMSISDEIMVLNYGEKIAEGPPQQIQTDPQVIQAYLGGDAAWALAES